MPVILYVFLKRQNVYSICTMMPWGMFVLYFIKVFVGLHYVFPLVAIGKARVAKPRWAWIARRLVTWPDPVHRHSGSRLLCVGWLNSEMIMETHCSVAMANHWMYIMPRRSRMCRAFGRKNRDCDTTLSILRTRSCQKPGGVWERTKKKFKHCHTRIFVLNLLLVSRMQFREWDALFYGLQLGPWYLCLSAQHIRLQNSIFGYCVACPLDLQPFGQACPVVWDHHWEVDRVEC